MKHEINFFTFLILFVASVMFLTLPVSASVIVNDDFYYNYTGWTLETTTDKPSEGTYTITWIELNSATHDGFARHYNYQGNQDHWVRTSLSQDINVTNVDDISVRGRSSHDYDDIGTFTVSVGSLSSDRFPTNSDWDIYSLNVSSLSGVQELKIELYSYTELYHYSAGYDVDWVKSDYELGFHLADSVSWDQDLYHSGDTSTVVTHVKNFDNSTYSYYLDLYNTQEYLTTYEITNETEFNYYTFPDDWVDTTILAKLQRVTNPDATNEIQLAYDISYFETSIWDTTVNFDKSSYNPSETLTVSWSSAPAGSTIWFRAMDDGEIIKPNVDYSGSFEFTVPSDTQETYYLVDVITNGVSQAQSSCVINLGDYFTDDYIFVTSYDFSDGDTYGLHNVDRAEYLNVTTETNINVDFVDVYYNNVYDDRAVSIDHIENLTGTDQVLKFPNDLGSGQYITIIYYHNITTGTQVELSYYTNVGEKGEGIDIYNAVITMDDTKEIIDVESISGYRGNDLVVPLNRVVIFDIYADEIINSSTVTENNLYEGDANYNSTSDYHLKRSYLFDVVGLSKLEFTVHNDETNTDDILKYKVYVQGIDQTELDGSVVMYWTKSQIELGDIALLYFNVTNMPEKAILTITSTGKSKYSTERTLHQNQTGTESIPDYYNEAGVYTATITCEEVVYAISTLTIVDPDAVSEEDEDDIAFDTSFESMLSSGAFVALLIIIACVGAFGQIGGVVGVFLGMVVGISISFLMGYLPAWILFIMVLALCVVFVSKLINSFGGGE